MTSSLCPGSLMCDIKISRGNRLFAQCVSWCRSDRLPVHFAASLSSLTSFPASHVDWSFASIRVPPSDNWMVFCAGGVALSSDGLLVLRTLLFSLNKVVWPDEQHLCTERLSLFGRVLAMPCGERCPLPVLISNCLVLPGFTGIALRQNVELFECSP